MAAVLLVFAGTILKERAEKSRAQKKEKKELDESRYRELVEETERRLSRTESGQVIRYQHSGTESEDDEVSEQGVPPPYESVVRTNSLTHPGQGPAGSEHQASTKNDKKKTKRRFSFLRKG